MSGLLDKKAMFMLANVDKVVKYGYLYNWYVTQGTGSASITSSDIWSVGTDANFVTLYNYTSNNTLHLRESGLIYWNEPNTGADNSLNFNGRGAGRRKPDTGDFELIKQQLIMWELDSTTSTTAYDWAMGYSGSGWAANLVSKKYGHSLRLVRPVGADSGKADGTACDDYIGNDGTKYPTVKIGTQVWLACNLAETKYRGLTDITNVTDNTQWTSLTSGARCAYNNDESNVFETVVTIPFSQSVITYGFLYNWYVTQNSSPITSSDTWSVPGNTEDYYPLFFYVGGTVASVYANLRETGVTYWLDDTAPSTNMYKFNSRGGGYRLNNSNFIYQKAYAEFWTRTDNGGTEACAFILSNTNTAFPYTHTEKKIGCSIRLVRPYVEGELNKLGQVTTLLSNDGNYMADYIGNDGQIYKTVKIGTQVWLAENLIETKYRNGNPIVNVPDNTQWAALTTGGYCLYNNDITNK